MNFVEVVVKTDLDSGELLAMIEGDQVLGAWESDGSVHLFWPEDKWDSATLEDIKKALSHTGARNPSSILAIHSVPDQDWNAKWAASLNPIRLGRRVRIRQSWHDIDSNFSGIELVIDPKRAFGTGYHATTQLVVEWLEEHIRGRERVLDIGTGTGILAMTAIRLGAFQALGIDNDTVAVECAREYCDTNGFGPELQLRVASFEDLDPDRFDVVLANLDIRALPGLCRHIPRFLKSGGAVCLSGMQRQDLDEISEALSREGLYIEAKTEREDWICLSCKSSAPPPGK